MARLFITPREVDFINDIAKEVIKDVIGQKVFYYSINILKTDVHDVYEEAPEKIFETPIEIDAIVNWTPEEVRTNAFGSEEYYSIEAYLSSRDLLDKGINVVEGDYFSFGSLFFEITSSLIMSNIYGLVEYKTGVKITGKQARKGQIVQKVLGPSSEAETDSDAVQDKFVQQRGLATNDQGPTGDVRALQKKGVLDKPISGPAEVSKRSSGPSSSFYDES